MQAYYKCLENATFDIRHIAYNTYLMHSKKEGNQFERIFELEAKRTLIGVQKINSTSTMTKGGWVFLKSPYDFILAYQGQAAIIDTKTYQSDILNHSALDQDQLRSLENMDIHGLPAGYVVWFRQSNKVVFFPVQVLLNLNQEHSLKPEDGELLGSIETMNLRKLFNGNETNKKLPSVSNY